MYKRVYTLRILFPLTTAMFHVVKGGHVFYFFEVWLKLDSVFCHGQHSRLHEKTEQRHQFFRDQKKEKKKILRWGGLRGRSQGFDAKFPSSSPGLFIRATIIKAHKAARENVYDLQIENTFSRQDVINYLLLDPRSHPSTFLKKSSHVFTSICEFSNVGCYLTY